MKKSAMLISMLFAVLLSSQVMAEDAKYVDLDKRGDQIEDRLDKKGDRIDDRLEKRADIAAANGHEKRAARLEHTGNKIDRRLDKKGDRINRRLDKRADRRD